MRLPEKYCCLTGFHLKLIALASMMIDHFGAIVVLELYQVAIYPAIWPEAVWLQTLLRSLSENLQGLITVYDTLRIIGRMAFPIYCFLLVEGFVHTRNPARYALRLLLFALLSEIPFDLAFQETPLEFTNNNVFFTLLTGLLLIWSISLPEHWLQSRPWPRPVRWLLYGFSAAVLTAVFCFVTHKWICPDYEAYGVLIIAVMYVLRRFPVPAFCVSTLILATLNPIELYALFMCIPVALYNGQRGKPVKLLFYLFYPLHLLLYWLLTCFLSA